MMNESSVLFPIVGVGIMILDCENRVLLGHRIKSGETPSWCFPGGKVDAQESLEQSAAREIFEETHLSLSSDLLKPVIVLLNRENPRVNMTTGLYIQLQSDEIKADLKVTEPHIFESWQWFDLNELPCPLFPETEAMLQYWMQQTVNEQFAVYPLK